MIISSCLLLSKIGKFDFKKLRYLLFISGMLTCYLDFLTTPILNFVVPLLIYYIYTIKQEGDVDKKYWIWNIFLSGISWGLGYGLTWISKWIICDIVLGTSIFQGGISQVLYRTKGNVNEKDGSYNLTFLFAIMFETIYFTYLLIMISYLANKNSNKNHNLNNNKDKENKILYDLFERKNRIVTYIIVLIPFIWFLTLFNHSVRHIIFSYRNILPLLIIIALIILKGFSVQKRKKWLKF